MVGAFLDSWLTGDPEVDVAVLTFCRPSLGEVASVAGLAARLYLGGAATPRRYFAWGQAVRRAVLAVMLVHAVLGLEVLVRAAWSRRLFGLPAPPASLGGRLARRCLARGVSRGERRLGRYLRDAGPRALPHGPGPRGAGHRPRPGRVAASPAHRHHAGAVRAVGLVGAVQPCPGPGHDRVPPRRPAPGAPALATVLSRAPRPPGSPTASAVTSATPIPTISVADHTWILLGYASPSADGAFDVTLPSRNQALQLQRILAAAS